MMYSFTDLRVQAKSLIEPTLREPISPESSFVRWTQAKHGKVGVNTPKLTAFCRAIRYGVMKVFWVGLGLALVATPLSGCVEDVRYNPSGCEVHVRGRWLIDGQNPSPETCGNIALVELAIIDEPETQFWVPPEFSLRCDADDANAYVVDGAAYIDTRFVTRNRCGGSGEILDLPPLDGYKSRWRGTTDLKFVVDCTPIALTEITQIGDDLVLDLGTIDLQTLEPGTTCPERP